MKKNEIITLLVFLLAGFFQGSYPAQVVYTDVVPDSTVSASLTQQTLSYFINLDNTGPYEFELRHFNPGPGNEDVELQSNTGNDQVLLDMNGRPKVFALGDTIKPGLASWGQNSFGVLNTAWYGGSDKCFGFRFTINGVFHYGWARTTMPADHTSFTIKDYAYEATPNTQIVIGQTTPATALPRARAGEKAVGFIYPNPLHNSAVIQFNTSFQQAVLNLYDVYGRQVKSVAGRADTRIVMERDDLPAGPYFYQVWLDENTIAAGKLMIAD